jgi:hypothetical protein
MKPKTIVVRNTSLHEDREPYIYSYFSLICQNISSVETLGDCRYRLYYYEKE